MPFSLDNRSLRNLDGVHPDLVRVVKDCAANFSGPITFVVIEGLRSLKQQKLNVASGASQTLRSRHLDGHAVDLAALLSGHVSWAWPHYDIVSREMKAAAARCNVPIEWGGDWESFRDGPHFQLPWDVYPSGQHVPTPVTAIV